MLALAAARGMAADTAEPPKTTVLIVDGMNNHDWPRATEILKAILTDSGRFAVDVSTSPAAGAPREAWTRWRPEFARYDVVLSNFNGGHKPVFRVVEQGRHVDQAVDDLAGLLTVIDQ